MTPAVHKRYLDYRARHDYFGAGQRQRLLSGEEFAKLDAELTALIDKGDARDDEEEARHTELRKILFRD